MAVLSVANVIRLMAVVVMLAGIVWLLPGQQVSQPATPHHGWYGVGDAGADGGTPGVSDGIFVEAFAEAFN